MAAYVPAKGDLIALTFDPQAGHEQKGRRPALVISNDLFNQRTGLAIVCPITNTQRNFPFHVALPEESSVTGFVMVEQVKAIDHRARRARFLDKIPVRLLNEVLSLLDACIY
ncbi:MAG TPA: type II toxin-antitoxin system PemK/MazF family toxin [Thermoanaerobaculia bacterium]|jgi:mRNA interferase MazF|nr:type II toxin-antitoxin system PemK/MazF family toxin [Thermoanaerobaculia bacterium]